MQSKAATVEAYLKELPAERRTAIQAIRKVILENLAEGFEEGMGYGMITYFVPHSLFPAGYHCDPKQPLMYAALASQKHYMSVYLTCVYGSEAERQWFERAWAKSGKKLDMGKCCVRFKRLEDASLDAIGQAIARVTVKRYVAEYVKARREHEENKGDPRKRTGRAPGLNKNAADGTKKTTAPGTRVGTKARGAKAATRTRSM